MRVYQFSTQTFPARGGMRRGLSLNGVLDGPPTDDVTEALFFGIADMVDPKTGRVEDTGFTIILFHQDGTAEQFDGVGSWTFDAQQFYSDISFTGGPGVVGGTVAGSESVSGLVKTMQISVTVP